MEDRLPHQKKIFQPHSLANKLQAPFLRTMNFAADTINWRVFECAEGRKSVRKKEGES